MKRFNLKMLFAALAIGVFAVSCEKEGGSILDDNGGGTGPVEKPERWLVAAEQLKYRIIVVNTKTEEIEWEWTAAKAGLPANTHSWFTQPDEVKPVYNGEYFLITSSSGGVALIRKSDFKAVFYAQPKGSPHSAEVLPDGCVVVACSTVAGSTEGDQLKLYKLDAENPFVAAPVATYPLKFGHNAVWDRKRQLLWATADDVIHSYTYSNTGGQPQLILKETIDLPSGEGDAHDMFPVHGEERLWLSTGKSVYKFDVSTKTFTKLTARTSVSNIKSVSSGPGDYPVMMLRPTTSWWSYNLIDTNGNPIYVGPTDLRIYKARWMLNNTFSYPEDHEFVPPQ